MEEIKLCNYGCGKEAKFYFKTVNKWCCSKSKNSCTTQKEINSKLNKGIKKPLHTEEWKINHSNRMRGDKNSFYGKQHSLETLKNWSEKRKGRYFITPQGLLIGIEKLKNRWKDPNSKFNSKSFRELLSNNMKKNGNYIRRQKKRVSKNELKLRLIIKQIYPTSNHTLKILNYDVDIAIIEYKIAIEYDGYYHFDTEEHKEYHKMRQEKIENEGWKFLRYTMFDKFPTKEQVENDIKNLIEG